MIILIFAFIQLHKYLVKFDVTLLSLFKFLGMHMFYDEKLFTDGLISTSVILTYSKRKIVHKLRNFRTERSLSAVVYSTENVCLCEGIIQVLITE